MKHLSLLLSLSLVLVLAHVARADSFDSDTATIKKGKCDKCAMIMIDKSTYPAMVSFGDDASWSSVKDHYELSDPSVKCVKSGHAKVSIASDGTASFKK